MLRRGKAESDFVKQRKTLINCNALAYFKGSLQECRVGQPRDFQSKRQLRKTLSVPSCIEGDANTLLELRASSSLKHPDQGSLQLDQLSPHAPPLSHHTTAFTFPP